MSFQSVVGTGTPRAPPTCIIQTSRTVLPRGGIPSQRMHSIFVVGSNVRVVDVHATVQRDPFVFLKINHIEKKVSLDHTRNCIQT